MRWGWLHAWANSAIWQRGSSRMHYVQQRRSAHTFVLCQGAIGKELQEVIGSRKLAVLQLQNGSFVIVWGVQISPI